MRRQIEDQVRHDAEADRAAQRRPAESFLDDQPRQDRGAGGGCHRVRVGHVGEMHIRHAPHGRFRRRSFDAEVVEPDPGQLHGLHGDENRRERDRRIPAFDEQRGRGMVDSKHGQPTDSKCLRPGASPDRVGSNRENDR